MGEKELWSKVFEVYNKCLPELIFKGIYHVPWSNGHELNIEGIINL